ncbi:hypothetical protein OH76DRAFT_914507 [Lentinus brumalis]|uniref:Uncharacterized protein n=1 Tax=Lentinus brumalis TaxID=2498619 RepID=A0A371D052_9APHY|nr:hypothetical protein OH76DRAFT_914507 [Polyporus brumalis]
MFGGTDLAAMCFRVCRASGPARDAPRGKAMRRPNPDTSRAGKECDSSLQQCDSDKHHGVQFRAQTSRSFVVSRLRRSRKYDPAAPPVTLRESRLWSAHFSVLNKQYPCFLLPHDRTRLTVCSSHQHFLDVRCSSENDRSHRSPSRGRTAYHPAAIIIADHDVRSAAGFEIGEIRVHSGRARALSPSKCVVPDAVFQAIATGY